MFNMIMVKFVNNTTYMYIYISQIMLMKTVLMNNDSELKWDNHMYIHMGYVPDLITLLSLI